MSKSLCYLSEARLIELLNDVPENLARYEAGNFLDLAAENGWKIQSELVKVDVSKLESMDGGQGSAKEDIKNSIVVYEALQGMTPAIAMDERIWVRLSHVECLNYARSRWLAGQAGDELQKSATKHMFAKGRPGIRDDNAISRLWWNMHIANMIDPTDPEDTLRVILLTSDYRMALIERSYTSARLPLARAIISSLKSSSWISERKDNFLQFMKELNRDAGGLLFESVSPYEAEKVVELCSKKARLRMGL
jgi:hypothetical protein